MELFVTLIATCESHAGALLAAPFSFARFEGYFGDSTLDLKRR